MREAAILAGGLGTRLRGVLPETPKILAPVAGRPFVAYLLDQLRDAGIERTILLTGYKATIIEGALGRDHHGMALVYSREEVPLDTAGAIRLALPLIAGASVLVLNGDSYLDIRLRDFIDWYCSTVRLAALSAVEMDDTSRYGRVRLGEDGSVQEFSEKSAGKRGRINAGVYLLSRQVIEAIPQGRSVSLEREVFPGLIGKGLWGFPCSGEFLDIGTPKSYAQAEAFLARRGKRH